MLNQILKSKKLKRIQNCIFQNTVFHCSIPLKWEYEPDLSISKSSAYQMLSRIKEVSFTSCDTSILKHDLKYANLLSSLLHGLKNKIIIRQCIRKFLYHVHSAQINKLCFCFLRGTHGYMAPEVLSKGTAYDSSADWFSFGCMLYKLLKG